MKTLFLITSSTHDKYEICEGLYVICADDATEAQNIYKKRYPNYNITLCIELNNNISGIIFYRDPIVE